MIDKIDADLKAAMLARQSNRVSVLRGLKSSLKNEQIKLKRELNESEILMVIKREAKQRDESATAFSQGGAEERAAQELAEKAIVEQYLPAMMSEQELEKLVNEAIAKNGKDPKQTGTIIGQVMGQSKGLADGKVVAEMVKRKLA